VGVFWAKFSMTLAAKLLMGPKKVGVEMMARTTTIIMQNLVEIERRISAWEDEVCLFFLKIMLSTASMRGWVTSTRHFSISCARIIVIFWTRV